MINLLRVSLIIVAGMTTGCESLSRWKTAGTRTLVSFIPREVDKRVGQAAELSQNPLKSLDSVPEESQRLIELLAEPILKNVDLTPLQPKIQMTRANVPNAYAFPHGGIFVTTKLLQISKSPDEILAVLAHEVAHVVQRHSMQQLVTQMGTNLAINVVLGDLGALADLASTGSQLLSLKFSRDHEREADSLGAEILRRGKLPLGGMVAFFQRMQDYEKANDVLPGDKNVLSFLMTHPPTQERIEAARALESPSDWKVPAEQQAAYEKLKKIFSK